MNLPLEKAAGVLDAVRQAALLRRWAKSSAEFAYGAPLITADELDADALKPFPERDDVRWLLAQLDSAATDSPVDQIVWKSRQHFATHACHGNHIWLAAFYSNRSIAYVAQEEQEGKDHVEEKIVGMWERLPPWFTKRFSWQLTKSTGVFVLSERDGQPWRSFIEPIARGSKKLRSWTYSRIHFDEAAFNEMLEASFTGAYATVRGRLDPKTGRQKKGQIVMTTSAAYHKWLINLSGAAFEMALEMARQTETHDADLPLLV